MNNNAGTSGHENPYAAPAYSTSDSSAPAIPRETTLLEKFGESISVWTKNLPLLAALVLTVWLPGNLLTNYLTYYVLDDGDVLQAIRGNMWIEALFGPIYVAAIIYALGQLKQGRRPGYLESLEAGFRNWGRLFGARLVAGIFVVLGFVAFVIPGIVLSVRYALLDSVVVLEGAGPAQARRRSSELTAGKGWQIVGAWLAFYVPFMTLSSIIYGALEFLPEWNDMVMGVVIDSCVDLGQVVFEIVLFQFYWEAAGKSQAGSVPVAHEGDLGA